ncbi:MAG: hypothetical protein U0U67_15530 [Chitinophagales bacterium]
MNAIVFNTLKSKIPPITESIAFRAAYIFSMHATTAGDSGSCMINFEEMLKRFTIDSKAKTLINTYAVSDPEASGIFTKLRADLKRMNAVKHKNNKLIIAIKHGEKIINSQYDYYVEHTITQARNLGFIQLKPLSDKKQLYYLPVMTEKQEGSNNPDSYDCSTILKCAFEQIEDDDIKNNTDDIETESEEPFLFFVTPEFFDYTDKTKQPVNSNHIDAANNDAIVMELFFSLPNINCLSALELEAVRASFADLQKEWYDTNIEWIKLCVNGSPDILNFFIEKIMPLKDAIQVKLDANDTIRNIKKINNNNAYVKVYAGLIPVKKLYDFYFTENVVQQETMDIVNEYLNSTGKENYRVPFMAINSNLMDTKIMDEIKEDTVVSVKKYLDID